MASGGEVETGIAHQIIELNLQVPHPSEDSSVG